MQHFNTEQAQVGCGTGTHVHLATYFADPHTTFEQASTRDQHRGRIETRSLRVSSELNSYLTDWPLIQQVAELTRTVTGEDRSHLRSGHAPQIFATLRNLAITLLHRQGSSQIAASRRRFASHLREAFRLLLSRRSA